MFSFFSFIYKELFKIGKKEVGIGIQRIVSMTEKDAGSWYGTFIWYFYFIIIFIIL